MTPTSGQKRLKKCSQPLHHHGLKVLTQFRVPLLVGGAYALERYTGIKRRTKDLDLFVHLRDCCRSGLCRNCSTVYTTSCVPLPQASVGAKGHYYQERSTSLILLNGGITMDG